MKKILELIRKNKHFLIVTHVNPEGDAVGSCVALALGLRNLGKSVHIASRDPVPGTLKFLPHSGLVSGKVPSGTFDVLFVVDCPGVERTGLNNLRAKTAVIIDHHVPSGHKPGSSRQFGVVHSFVDPAASAAGELVYRLLRSLGISISREMAVNLFTAIYTDTGGFRYPNTRPETLSIASRLIKAGADPWEVTKEVYENQPFNRLRLLALSLATLEKKGRTAWITVTDKMFKKTKTSAGDTENFVDFPRKVKGVEVAVLFRQEGDKLYKVSLRSKGSADVEKIANSFGGGGHARAAGCTIKGSLPDARKKIHRAVKKALNNGTRNKPQ